MRSTPAYKLWYISVDISVLKEQLERFYLLAPYLYSFNTNMPDKIYEMLC